MVGCLLFAVAAYSCCLDRRCTVLCCGACCCELVRGCDQQKSPKFEVEVSFEGLKFPRNELELRSAVGDETLLVNFEPSKVQKCQFHTVKIRF